MINLYDLKNECVKDLNKIGIYPKFIRNISWIQDNNNWGFCKNVLPGIYDIEISNDLQESYSGAKEIMFHELLHACGEDYCNHSDQWKEYAQKCNALLNTHIKEISNAEDIQLEKAAAGAKLLPLTCPACGGNLDAATLVCESCKTKYLLIKDSEPTLNKKDPMDPIAQRIQELNDEDARIFARLMESKLTCDDWRWDKRKFEALLNHPEYVKIMEDTYHNISQWFKGNCKKTVDINDLSLCDAIQIINKHCCCARIWVNNYNRLCVNLTLP